MTETTTISTVGSTVISGQSANENRLKFDGFFEHYGLESPLEMSALLAENQFGPTLTYLGMIRA